jgi:hypothetical protein
VTDKRREPGPPAGDPAAGRVRDRRTQTFATLAPLLGVFLLMPPFIQVFAGAGAIFGVPAIVVYIFGVWGALIAAAGLIARRLSRPPAGDAHR